MRNNNQHKEPNPLKQYVLQPMVCTDRPIDTGRCRRTLRNNSEEQINSKEPRLIHHRVLEAGLYGLAREEKKSLTADQRKVKFYTSS